MKLIQVSKKKGSCGKGSCGTKFGPPKGKLDTQMYPECEGTQYDRDVVKKNREKRKKEASDHSLNKNAQSEDIDTNTHEVGKITSLDQAKQMCIDNEGRLPKQGRETLIDIGVIEKGGPSGTVWGGTQEYEYKTFLTNEADEFRVWTYISVNPVRSACSRGNCSIERSAIDKAKIVADIKIKNRKTTGLEDWYKIAQFEEQTDWEGTMKDQGLSELPLFSLEQFVNKKFIVKEDLLFDGNTWLPTNQPREYNGEGSESINSGTVLTVTGIQETGEETTLGIDQSDGFGFDMTPDNFHTLLTNGFITQFNMANSKNVIKVAVLTECPCGSGEHPEEANDARGIFLCYVCKSCKKEKLSKYRPDVLDDSNYWSDEPIEPEDY